LRKGRGRGGNFRSLSYKLQIKYNSILLWGIILPRKTGIKFRGIWGAAILRIAKDFFEI
jgi:hypothetical protein